MGGRLVGVVVWSRKQAVFAGGGWERLEIDFKNPTKLTGKTNGERNTTWMLQK